MFHSLRRKHLALLVAVMALSLFLIPRNCFAAPEVVLKGKLTIEGGELINYKIVLVDYDSAITGFATTWKEEQKDTKAKITGIIDRKKRTLSFQETEIIYNNGFESNAILCLFQATLLYKYNNTGYSLSGPVSSTDLMNASCSRGLLSFTTEDVLKALFAPRAARPVAVNEPVKATPDTVVAATAKITTGMETVLEWKSDTAVIDVWDGGHLDNDIISIKYNGITVLSRFTITHQKKQLRLPLTGKSVDVITVIADSEGSEPPNTANLMLTDGRMQYPVVAYNAVGREAVIKIKKTPKK